MPDLAFARVFCAKILFCSFWVSGTLSAMSKKKAHTTPPSTLKKAQKFSVQTALLCLFGFGLVLQFFQVSSLEKRVESLTPGGSEGSSLGDFFGTEDSEEVKEDDLSTLLFDFVNNLGAYEENKARYEANLAALQTAMSEDFWGSSLLMLQVSQGTYTEEGLEYVFSNGYDNSYPGHPVLTLTLAYDGTLSLDAYGTEVELYDELSVESTVADFKTYLKDDLEVLRARIQSVDTARGALVAFESSSEFQAIVTQKGLKVLPEEEQTESFLTVFQNVESLPVAECRVFKEDARVMCKTVMPEDETEGLVFEDMKAKVLEIFAAVDGRTELQKQVDAQKEMIVQVLADPAFAAALGNANLSVGPAVETDTSIQYPILNAAGETLRLLLLDKATGEVKVSQPDGQETHSLSAEVQLLEFSSKKKLWTSPVSSQRMLS